MSSEAPQRIVGFAPLKDVSVMLPYAKAHRKTYHDALWQVGLGDDDRAHLLQKRHKYAVLLRRFEDAPNIPKRTIVALDIELILEGHGHPMKGPYQLTSLFELIIQRFGLSDRIVKKDLGKAT